LLPARGAVAADFEAGHQDMKVAVALHLALDPVEEVAFELLDFAVAMTGT